jgi:hypothetical protein
MITGTDPIMFNAGGPIPVPGTMPIAIVTMTVASFTPTNMEIWIPNSMRNENGWPANGLMADGRMKDTGRIHPHKLPGIETNFVGLMKR